MGALSLSERSISYKFRPFNRAGESGRKESYADRYLSRRADTPYFRIYDLRSTYATRLSAGGVADEWVTQMLRQGEAKVFKKYSQMKVQMKREALIKLNRHATEANTSFATAAVN